MSAAKLVSRSVGRFLAQQERRPSRLAGGWLGAGQGDDAGFLSAVERAPGPACPWLATEGRPAALAPGLAGLGHGAWRDLDGGSDPVVRRTRTREPGIGLQHDPGALRRPGVVPAMRRIISRRVVRSSAVKLIHSAVKHATHLLQLRPYGSSGVQFYVPMAGKKSIGGFELSVCCVRQPPPAPAFPRYTETSETFSAHFDSRSLV